MSDYKSNYYVQRQTNDSGFAWSKPSAYMDLDEEKFLEYIKKYEGTSYYEQALNALNTYKNNVWSPNAWQAGAYNLFNDASAFLNFQNGKNGILDDAMSRIEEAFHQESHNSTPNQVAQAVAAGINSDLSGSVPQSPAGNIDQPEVPTLNMNDGSSVLPDIGATAMQVFTTAMSLAQGFQSLESGDLQLMLGSLDLSDKSNELMIDALGKGLSENDVRLLLDPSYVDTLWNQFATKSDGTHNDAYDDDPDFINEWKSNQKSQVQDKLGNVIKSISEDKRLPLSLRRKIKKSFKPGVGALDVNSKLYELLENTYGHKKSAIENAGHPFSQLGFEKALEIFGKHINETVIKIRESDAKVREKENKFTEDKLSVVGPDGKSLGTHAGESDLHAYDAESSSKEYQGIVDGMWTGILHDLEAEDSLGAKILLFLIPIARSLLSNISLPSVSHSTSIDSKGNQSSSSSFGF